ncbi:hypothetical protein BJ138DRAFT_1052409 [Hygrophoropsis aurantiaca]|uniref:Uncharacterized protein n=1 Tax=Hygrophoropsis aurantiaca TaxID=72124 RepID=A0ACB8AT74_9AGAM|nr:hypothetical protein BJ138DRAFT_1052409 [Hygrophoropsis aurantiaca]
MRHLTSIFVALSFILTQSTGSVHNGKPDLQPDCRARSWVRAPDMIPGAVIRGDVKILLDGDCPEVESYALGLRFKERILFKILQDGAAIPDRPTRKDNSNLFGPPREVEDIFKPSWRWGFGNSSPAGNDSEWKFYEDAVTNKDLWFVHEEETTSFEIKYQLDVPSTGGDLVSKFGLLIPDTNYPPALDHRISGAIRGDVEIHQTESIYEYFTEMLFTNGTLKQFPAGITAFQPLYPPRLSTQSNLTVIVPLETDPKRDVLHDPLQSNYTAEITIPSNGIILQGSTQNLSTIVHRSGYSNRTDTVAHINIFTTAQAQIKWSDIDFGARGAHHMPRFWHRSLTTALDFEPVELAPAGRRIPIIPPPPIVFPKLNSPEADKDKDLGQLVTTSSEPFTLLLSIQRDHVPDFAAHYHDLKTQICLSVQVRNGIEEPYDPSGPWDNAPVADDVPYDWVPWSEQVKQKPPRFPQGCTNVSVVLQSPTSTVTPVHYLSTDARTPIFVDDAAVSKLRARSRAERNLLAPLANQQTKVTAKGDEKLTRYFSGYNWREPIYVGETWVKKVLPSLERNAAEEHISPLVVQIS